MLEDCKFLFYEISFYENFKEFQWCVKCIFQVLYLDWLSCLRLLGLTGVRSHQLGRLLHQPLCVSSAGMAYHVPQSKYETKTNGLNNFINAFNIDRNSLRSVKCPKSRIFHFSSLLKKTVKETPGKNLLF